jgi:NitT/TauT family transport system permease protein
MKTSIINPKTTAMAGGVLWLLLWQTAALVIDQAIYLPAPLEVMKRLVLLLGDPDFFRVLGMTTYRVLVAFGLSAALGVTLGALCGLKPTLEHLFRPLVSLIRSTPVISVIILAIVWLNSTHVPIFTGFLMCFPIIWTSAVSGVRSADPHLVEMAGLYQVRPAGILLKVYLPAALPTLKAGFVSALGLGFKVIAAGEVLALPRFAIGSRLHDAKVYLQIPDLLAWTLFLILLSYVFEQLLDLMLKHFLDRRRSPRYDISD